MNNFTEADCLQFYTHPCLGKIEMQSGNEHEQQFLGILNKIKYKNYNSYINFDWFYSRVIKSGMAVIIKREGETIA